MGSLVERQGIAALAFGGLDSLLDSQTRQLWRRRGELRSACYSIELDVVWTADFEVWGGLLGL
jgi:hypothetical protein